jgi:hypothetical protein
VVSIAEFVGITGSIVCFSCDILGLVSSCDLVSAVAFGPCCVVLRV